jgi:hypothetical protein
MAKQEEDQVGAKGGCEDKGMHWNVQGQLQKKR